MENIMNDRFLTVLIVLATFLYIGWTYRTNDSDNFHTARRQVGTIRSVATLFTVVGAPHFAIFTSLAFFIGWLALGFYVGAFIGLVILAFAARKIRSHIPSDAHSYNDIAAEEIGTIPAGLLTIIGIAFVVGVIIAQLILGAQLLSTFSGVSYLICVLLIMATIVGYLFWGGAPFDGHVTHW